MSSLAGIRVAITRDDPTLAGELRARGADVTTVPLVSVAPPADLAALRAVDLGAYDWLMLTSANGVDAVAEHVGAPPASTRIGVVGETTAAAAAAAFGRRVDFVPGDQRAAGMVAEFRRRPSRIVVIHADAAAPTLVDGLRAAGHDVTSVVGYRTIERRPSDEQLTAITGADVVVVASGSAIRALITAAGDGAADGAGDGEGDRTIDRARPIVAIGPSTAAAATTAGFIRVTVASAPTTPALVAAVVSAATR